MWLKDKELRLCIPHGPCLYTGALEATAEADAKAGASQRERLRDLFHQLDTNMDGRLDATEFREGMRRAGDELAGPEVATIFQAMDIHGWLTLDDFLAIAEVPQPSYTLLPFSSAFVPELQCACCSLAVYPCT